ncbi:type B 50S ribosomal protein L31 [Pseudomonas fulva]|nr:type B 50S ribosomal protein L31 [Pseudomonas fulva]MBF8781457.1 type B 50S ribosomal protein L31 [Pseudomonas fulva]
MKAGIHPEYRTVLFHDTAADVFFLIGSTAETDRTYQHTDGQTYPYVALDVSSASHPVYTGQQRKAQSEGRVAGFNKRFAGFAAKPVK